METNSKVIQLLEVYSDDVRHPLIVENPDWDDKIIPALVELGQTTDAGLIDGEQFANLIRCMIEIAYVMGYQKGNSDGS